MWAAPVAVSGPDGGLSVDHDPVGSAAMDRAGNALVVWASAGVRAARFTAGAGWSAPACLTGSPVGDPRVAFEASGRALASWGESGVPTARWFDPALGWMVPIQFPRGTAGGWRDYSGAVTAFDGAGRALLLWERALVSGLTTTYDVWATLFDGSAWRELGPVSSSGVSSGGPGVGTDSQGRGLSVWAEPDRLVFARFDFSTGLEPPRSAVAVAQAGPIWPSRRAAMPFSPGSDSTLRRAGTATRPATGTARRGLLSTICKGPRRRWDTRRLSSTRAATPSSSGMRVWVGATSGPNASTRAVETN